MKLRRGKPAKVGMYVAYTEFLEELDMKFPMKKLLMWSGGRWCYPSSDQFFRGNVLGWIGPLPSPTIEDLIGPKYAIGTEESASKGAFHFGPYDSLERARQEYGDDGEFIYKLKDGKAKKIAKWCPKKEKWLLKRKPKR